MTTYTDSSVTNNTKYYYKTCAQNNLGFGENSSEVRAAQVILPADPQNVQATSKEGEIVLTWHPPASNGGSSISSYKIYRGTSPENETLVATYEIWYKETEYSWIEYTWTDTGLANGTKYYYKVSAVNILGEGVLSTEVNATFIAAAPAASVPGYSTGIMIGLLAIAIVGVAMKKRPKNH